MQDEKPNQSLQNQTIIPFIVLGIGVLSASTGAIFIRFAQNELVSPLVIAFYRMLFATILLLPWIILKYLTFFNQISKRDGFFLGLNGLFLALHFAAWITSIGLTSIASSVVLVSTTPIWVVLASRFLFHEKISLGVIIGMVISIIGGIIVSFAENCLITNIGLACSNFTKESVDIPLGNLLAVIGAIMAATYLLLGRNLRRSIPLVPYTFFVYGFAALFLLIFVVITEVRSISYIPGSAIVWLILLAIIPQTMGHTSFNFALGHLSSVYVSIALLGEPIASTILGIIIFDEIPNPIKVIGALLILVGLGLVIVLNRESKLISEE